DRTFQLFPPVLPSYFAPPRSLATRRDNLPSPRTPLLGRERELAAVRDLLLRDEVVLVTLTGPGGSGKTQLSLAVAAELLDRFESGVYCVELAPIRDPGLLAASIAQALGVREEGGRPLLDSLKQSLQEKQMLLVLD